MQELADQGNLGDWGRGGKLLSLEWLDRKTKCREFCEGMRFLHDTAGVVHRDLKPENVLFKSEETRGGTRNVLKIADFGLSRFISNSRSRRTTVSGGAGTDCWMPPEGLEGRCGASSSVTFDIHPMGSLIFFMLSGGEHAFSGRSDHARNDRILKGKQAREFPAPPTPAPWRRERRST